jgi:MoaA/NifB/PqqE/SkfB family radical SAM enzyme
MRRINQDWNGNQILAAMRNAWRRVDWFTRGVSRQQIANGAMAAASFGLKRARLRSWPVMVKIDISPVCNLHCTYCVHATPAVDKTGILAEQSFRGGQRMPSAQFETIVNQIAGHSAAVALYYIGDPLMHPQLTQFCSTAAEAGLNCHISTNFSFRLSDDRLASIVQSGLSHLTVCVDSMRQDRYELTRVGGSIDLVLGNLERTLRVRKALGSRKPSIEVQFIKYQHNLDEVDRAAEWCRDRAVDQFTEYWGNLHNYADLHPSSYQTGDALEAQLFPRCAWPWFAMQVKYDGDVIPCCYHRVSEQYRQGGDARTVGNVIAEGLFNVWNSPSYHRIRRLTANPALAQRREPVSDSFCYGCPVVFNIAGASRVITADTARWEDVYFRSSSGEVGRR